MISLDEFRFNLGVAKTKEDFISCIVDFILSIEDSTLRLLILAELEQTLLEGRGRVNG